MQLTIIVARSKQGVIGQDNALPWRLPADLQHFKKITTGHPIIMGRNTWESLGCALPGRRNIVISRTKSFDPTDAECFDSLEGAIAACQNDPIAFIIGGAQVYEQALELDVVQQMIITEVDIDVVGDAHFPNFNQANWHETSRISFPSAADPKDPSRLLPAYAFVNYSRQI